MRTVHRGFSLLETLIALVLTGVAMTALILAFANSGKYGVLSRRQATALTVARSQAALLSHAPWTYLSTDASCTTTGLDARLADTHPNNNTTLADPKGVFASASLPTGSDAPDTVLGSFSVGNESYDAFVNVAPQTEGDGSTDGMQFAVIVRYKVAGQYMRAVALGYRYCPYTLQVGGQLPL
jgi:prepilin-type N-terminal cleavage/methylation domain-containing protein